MCYRLSSLLNIPVPTLVKVLGLELPAPPRVSLHGVSADTITLHWSLPEKAGTVAKHIVQINGINVGESEKRGETSVTVTGLNPNQRYSVRVIAANGQNFQAPGKLIRLRTRRKSERLEEASFVSGVHKGEPLDDFQNLYQLAPEASPMAPGPSSQAHNTRRSTKEKRGSLAVLEQSPNTNHNTNTNNNNNNNSSLVPQEGQHTVESLTEDLDAIRKEAQEAEAQLAHNEEEFKSVEAVLRAELDALKNKKNEEDAGRQRIRAETKSLEEARRTAEALRTRTEKALKAKECEIEKMQEDISQWEKEMITALTKVEKLKNSTQESLDNAAATEEELSVKIRESQKEISELEEEIRSLVAIMKQLESQKQQKKIEEDAEAKRVQEDVEKDCRWRERQRDLEMRYVTTYNAFQAAEVEFLSSREVLIGRHNRKEGGGSGGEGVQKKPKPRRNRNRKARQHAVSAPVNAYPLRDSFPDSTAINSMQHQPTSPTYSNSIPSSPFFNIANGSMSVSNEIPESLGRETMDPYRDNEMDYLTGGIAISPTANSLLPSNLFAYDDLPPSPKAPSLVTDSFPVRAANIESTNFKPPQSPISSGSVSTSAKSSYNSLPGYSSFSGQRDSGHYETSEHIPPISPIGTDRPTISSPNINSTAKSSSRRIVNLLSGSFNRQRGKTVGFEDTPIIGSLRPSESHSFPKNESQGLDPIGTRRRSGSQGSWSNGIEPWRPITSRPLERSCSSHSRYSLSFNQFNPYRIYDRSASPRPSSITSFDNPLPAPSSDASAAFGWPTDEQESPCNGFGGVTTSSHWGSDIRAGHMLQSRPVPRPISPNHHHRRHHHQHALSLSNIPNLVPPGFPQLTRPTTPRLNPAAPTFQSRMSTPAKNETPPPEDPQEQSRDSASIASTSSSTGTTPSDSSIENTPSKESILSRFSALSRKGSTGKFNLSWKKDNFFGKKKDEVEEEDTGTSGEAPQCGNIASGLVPETPISAFRPTGNAGLWSGWRKDGDDSDAEIPLSTMSADVTPSVSKEGSPWLKSNQSGFFGAIGRKKVERDDSSVTAVGEGEKGRGKERDRDGADGERKGLGIFRRKPAVVAVDKSGANEE